MSMLYITTIVYFSFEVVNVIHEKLLDHTGQNRYIIIHVVLIWKILYLEIDKVDFLPLIGNSCASCRSMQSPVFYLHLSCINIPVTGHYI